MKYYRETKDGGVEAVELDPEGSEFRQYMRDWGQRPRRVDLTKVGEYEVSTVFLGLDHSFGSGPPVLYETMIFKGDLTDLYMERYTTRQLAQGGHNAVVNRLRLGWVPDGSE